MSFPRMVRVSRFFSTCIPSQMSKFPGAQSCFTSVLDLQVPNEKRECYRVLDTKGTLLVPTYKPKLSNGEIVEMYKTMVTLNVMDQVFYDSQRQGRISFYMQNHGEEAVQIGSAAAITMDDVIFAQYREAGVLLWRGFGLQRMAHQLFSNSLDLGKGRQMPVHYGCREMNFQTISSPLATQLPQATGAAYAMKLEGKDNIVICYFGEGAASEGDFHPALNFAATLECPVVFFCRNNGFAISTPTHEQYRGDGIVSRAAGYGMASIRVDGNDLLAVHEATLAAKEYAVKNKKPVLIEAMCYRGGHHSTSDDSTRYRSPSDIKYWSEEDNPLTRTRLYLESVKKWDSELETSTREEARKLVMEAFNTAETQKKPPVEDLFTDVFDNIPEHLKKQRLELRAHLEKHHEHYGISEYEASEITKNL